MFPIQPSNAVDCPADYLDQLYLELPRLFAAGGTAVDVETLLGGVGPALAGALDALPGSRLELRMFPLPYGWAPQFDPDDEDGLDLAGLGEGGGDVPEVRYGEWSGFLFVPAPSGGWERWNPTHGPAPRPKDGHMCVLLAMFQGADTTPTICRMREVFGTDRSLRRPLYKPTTRFAPATAIESAHLVDTLRSLLATREAS